MSSAVAYAEHVFRKFGAGTPRHQQLDEGPASRDLLLRCLAAKSRNPRTLRQKVRVSLDFFAFLDREQKSLTSIDEWGVAKWLRSQALRCKTRGVLAFAALKWVEQAFGVCLHSSSELVRSQRLPCIDRSRVPRPVPAKCPSEEMVCMWEDVVASSLGSFCKCFAGAFCAMAHGMLRWSDLQRSSHLRLTPDALTAEAPMKNQAYLTPWAAPRFGFTGVDWAALWLDALRASNLPGPDFVLWASNSKGSAFTGAIADFKHAQIAMRKLLVRPPFSLTAAAAAQYSLHGFRHVYTTAMRQLALPMDDIDDAGHWRRGSEMVKTYDSADCVAELRSKETVRRAVASGWRRVSSACLPLPAPGADDSHPASSSNVALVAPTRVVRECVKTAPVFVVNIKTQILHTWRGMSRGGRESMYTTCRKWKCGSPACPAPRALWPLPAGDLDPEHFQTCTACFEETRP